MAGKVYREKYQIPDFETEETSRIHLRSILDLAMLVSGHQSNQLKIGEKTVHDLGVGWVVIQYDIQIHHLPRCDEHVILETWGGNYNRLFAERNFRILNQNGQVEISIRSIWVGLDMQKRKLTVLNPELVKPYGGKFAAHLYHLPRPKIIAKPATSFTRNYRVRYSDIDTNHHVTNASYLDWFEDTLSAKFLQTYRPTGLQIRFQKEVHYGTIVESKVEKALQANGVITRHEICSKGQINAVANIEWKKNRDPKA